MRNSLKKRLFEHLYSILVISCIFALVQKKKPFQWSGKRKWLWAIAAPSSQHSMGHFSVVFVKTKIFYGPFNFCMGHLTQNYKNVCIKRPMAPAFPNHCLFTVLVLFFVNFARKVSLEIFDKSRPKWMNYYFFLYTTNK
jgi:hypothetical protein